MFPTVFFVKHKFYVSRRSRTYPLFKTTASSWKVAWVRLSWVVGQVGNPHGAHRCNARLPFTLVMTFTTQTPGGNQRQEYISISFIHVHKRICCKYIKSLTLSDPFQVLVINKYKYRTICSMGVIRLNSFILMQCGMLCNQD